MSPARFYIAVALFHLVLVAVTLMLGRRAGRTASRQTGRAWLFDLARGSAAFAVAALGLAVVVTLGTVLPAGNVRASSLGSLCVRLLAQALFGEAPLLIGWAAVQQALAGARLRSALLASVTAGLVGVYWQAYHVEPRDLQVRRHQARFGSGGQETLRILHLTDIQTPSIGGHEERAFREGLAQHPDLVVLTGDYIHERVGRSSADAASADLRRLLTRLAFGAPLGVFATEGDAGLDCRTVFQGVPVQCLRDEGRRLELRGASLTIVGLSRPRSRERDPAALRRVIEGAPPADYRLVIGHAPDYVSALAGHVPVDLALAGHTHGGQVALPLLGPLFIASRLPRRYAGDLHDYQGIPLHVSRGVGMERGMAPQIRFLCPPEICILDVRYGRARRPRGDPGP